MRAIHHFLQEECGATSIEYSLIAALVTMGIVASISSLGSIVNEFFFQSVHNHMSSFDL